MQTKSDKTDSFKTQTQFKSKILSIVIYLGYLESEK